MAGPAKQERLIPDAPRDEHVVVLNDRCMVRTQEGVRIVLVAGVPLAQCVVGDRMAEAHAMVSLVEQGWADQNDVARAFDCTARTVRRHQRRFEAGGLEALGRRVGFPEGRTRVPSSRVRVVDRLKAEGQSNRTIAGHVGVSEKAVRKLLRRLGWTEPRREPEQLALAVQPADPNLSACSRAMADAPSADCPDPPSAADFGRALAERRVAARGAAFGFLYVDGRAYHGKHALPKAHLARMRISMPATTDYWTNDVAGEPLFVLTAEANAGLVKMLPPLLAEIRRLVGERRVTEDVRALAPGELLQVPRRGVR
jgi:transposase